MYENDLCMKTKVTLQVRACADIIGAKVLVLLKEV